MWSCDKLCNKFYECRRHQCKVKCHSDECGPCPFSLPRSCPCGKETTAAPCSVEIEPCGSTCQKKLACGNHFCTERCHRGDCPICLEIVEKKCRCGAYSKEQPCSKTFTCEAKCKRMKDCNKRKNRLVHIINTSSVDNQFSLPDICNKKCCDGQCLPCDKICGKMLSCGKHKCNLNRTHFTF